MKTVTTILLLIATQANAQTMNIQPGNSGGYSDGPSLVTKVPPAITAENNLKMSELVSSLYTNQTKIKSSIRITVTHKDKIAQQPDVCVAKFTPLLVQELYKLRGSYVDLMNRVASENADMQMEGMPNIISPYGTRHSNVFKRSDRDKESNERRAEQSAILQLKRLIKGYFTVRSYGMTNHVTHHYRVPDGEYLLCVIQRVNDNKSKGTLGSKTVLWWTRFVIDNKKPQALYLDETNAISWREIFITE